MVSETSMNFTFSDPKEYEGPIVEGWPPSKNRSVVNYLTGILK